MRGVMNKIMPKVSVILLTYNSKSKLSHFFDDSITSILLNNYPNLHLVVVDNGSRDDTVSYVKERLEKFGIVPFKILMLNKNYGWGGGNNKGAILARDSDFLFFLNDDVILENDCVLKLVTIMNKDVRVGAVQPMLMNEDGTLFCGADISLAGLPSAITSPRGCFFEIFHASGAALLTRTKYFFRRWNVR
jgi:GT2 family glycosyltransferase